MDSGGRIVNRWTLLDWVVTLAPFVILAAAGLAAAHRARRLP